MEPAPMPTIPTAPTVATSATSDVRIIDRTPRVSVAGRTATAARAPRPK